MAALSGSQAHSWSTATTLNWLLCFVCRTTCAIAADRGCGCVSRSASDERVWLLVTGCRWLRTKGTGGQGKRGLVVWIAVAFHVERYFLLLRTLFCNYSSEETRSFRSGPYLVFACVRVVLTIPPTAEGRQHSLCAWKSKRSCFEAKQMCSILCTSPRSNTARRLSNVNEIREDGVSCDRSLCLLLFDGNGFIAPELFRIELE